MSSKLFETAPEEIEQAGKRRPRKPPVVEHRRPEDSPADYPTEAHVLASLDVPCPYCGIAKTDLVEERWSDKKRQWLVQCGWNCLTSWLIDPIPGILDKADEQQNVSGNAFKVKGGLFDGKTFGEIAASGARWYIAGVAEKGRPYLAAAAKEWLSNNGG